MYMYMYYVYGMDVYNIGAMGVLWSHSDGEGEEGGPGNLSPPPRVVV